MAAIIHSFAVLLCFFLSNSDSAAAAGFSLQLIHRDSPISPFHNPLVSPSQRLQNALKRSISRLHRFTTSSSPSSWAVESEIITINGEYLMNISLGTPPFPILAVADTGSDVVWTQCKPCPSCYVQNDPLFDPASSGTYETLPCPSKTCSSLRDEGAFCAEDDAVCHYQVGYGDQSHTDGDLAFDTLTLRSTESVSVSFPKILFGCGHNNAGTFHADSSGIVGLGGGPASLISQLGPSFDYKFSYCLVRFGEETRALNFGANAVVLGGVSTPLIFDTKPSFYFLKLEGVSVGDKRIPFEAGSSTFGSSDGRGNIIIDSGTTLTMLPTEFLSALSDSVENQIVGGEKAEDPQGYLSLCYAVSDRLVIPRITVHFDGADVELPSSNVFIEVSDTVTCLAFYGSDDASIYGNVAQQNFLIGYDLQKRTLSIKPTDCAHN